MAIRNTSSTAAQTVVPPAPPATELNVLAIRIRQRELENSRSNAAKIRNKVLNGGDLKVARERCKEDGIGWEDWVTSALGYHPREARRLMTMHDYWGDWIGTGGSDAVLPLLPDDTKVLEWICRIPLEDVEEFVTSNDCRNTDRKTLIRAVQAIIGFSQVQKAWEQFLERASERANDIMPSLIIRVLDGFAAMKNDWEERFPLPSEEHREEDDRHDRDQPEAEEGHEGDEEENEHENEYEVAYDDRYENESREEDDDGREPDDGQLAATEEEEDDDE